MSKELETNEYRFLNEKGEHLHQILIDGEWKNLTGISSVVKDVTNFGMAAYYGSRRALMALGYDPKDYPEVTESFIREVNRIVALSPIEQQKALKNAYTAHAKYAKSRAKKGTDSHEVISKWAQDCIDTNSGKFLETDNPIIEKFLTLALPEVGLNARIIATEKHGFNKDHWLAGITDLILDTKDGLVIIDFKDRASIYSKDILQMMGYSLIFPLDIKYVVGIPLEGTKAWAYHNMEKGRKAFLGELDSYRFRNELESKY